MSLTITPMSRESFAGFIISGCFFPVCYLSPNCRCLNANPIPSIPPAVLPRKGAKENATARGPCFICGASESNYPLTGSPRIIYAPPETAGEVRYHAIFIKKNGDVAQLGERGVRNAEARGSIPLISTNTGKGGGRFVNKKGLSPFFMFIVVRSN